MAAASAAVDRKVKDLALHPLVRAVATALRRKCGVKAGATLLIAVSGGADSTALLRALHALHRRRTWRLGLVVGHVQHHLRDADGSGEADAAFVAQLAHHLGLPLWREDVCPSGEKVNVEQWARQARYAALGRMARAVRAQAVVVAHHADDQLETFLMRMLRGTSAAGLASMPWRRVLARGSAAGAADRVQLLRPMLAVDRAAVTAFLRDIQQSWRDDPTNADATRLRTRLRRDVVPMLRAIRGDAPAKAVALCDQLRQARRQLQRDAAALRQEALLDAPGSQAQVLHLSRPVLRGAAALLVGGLLRQVLVDVGVPGDALGRRALAPLVRAVRDRTGGLRRFGFAGGVSVQVTAKVVRVHGSATPNTASKLAR
jgi:tRNA(Ile)-lysidine synthase